MRRSGYLIAAGAAAATAALGTAATDVESDWYRRLDKPPFQPPGPVFGIAWTLLYTLIAAGTGRALARTSGRPAREYGAALGLNLLLNLGWSVLFFRGRSPALALADVLALQASTADLARRTRRVDGPAALLLAPYTAWVGFASVLTGEILRRNR